MKKHRMRINIAAYQVCNIRHQSTASWNKRANVTDLPERAARYRASLLS